jgi:FkbM family methyltransferase
MNIVKRAIVNLLQKTGWDIIKHPNGGYDIRPAVKLGEDAFRDVQRIYRRPCTTIFDVGANIGQTAEKLASYFPEARIFSFEPGEAAFARLQTVAQRLAAVSPWKLALGRESRAATFYQYRFNETNSLLPKAIGAEDFIVDSSYMIEEDTSTVDVTTIDEFCSEHDIASIDLLKIDTQGYELEVLAGARRLLQSVPFIYAEVTFVRYYEQQPLFQDVYQFLYERGYRLVALYESGFLTHYYQVGGNALFVHESYGARPAAQHRWKLGPVKVSW